MNTGVATGIQDFEQLRTNRSFYVDKTDFIKEWWNDGAAVTLITRPRRFGKTLNMSMMYCFFSNRFANRSDLFESLKIWSEQSFREMQGTFPVIFLSFAGIKGPNYRSAIKQMKTLIVRLYSRFPELYQAEELDANERAALYRITEEMSDDDAALSLNLLSALLEKHYHKKALIFLDEYDTPLQEAYLGGYWNKLVSFIRVMFNNTFKTNPALSRAILTGITRVSKESIFSDLNNLDVVTTTSAKYASCFGFMEQEVFQAMREKGFNEAEMQDVKDWYDGFTFGDIRDIYNPWSVTSYLDKRLLDTYWANTSENALVSSLIQQGNAKMKSQFELLLEGNILTVPLDEQIVFEQLKRRENAIWSLLLSSGYLRVVGVDRQRDKNPRKRNLYRLALTNREVQIMFDDMIEGWFEEGQYFNEFVEAMFSGNERDMNRYMNRIALKTFSYFDAGEKPGESEPERFYHGFVLGLLVDQAEDYDLKSNRESGYGRYDVVLEPKEITKPAVIIEFKVIDSEAGEGELRDTALHALEQIDEKKYDAELLARGIPEEKILKYGFAFKGKECLIIKGR